MTKLSVNLNKIALLRNSRGRNFPNVIAFGEMAIRAGADGLTIHPRPDQRHAKYSDIAPLISLCEQHSVELNIEGYPTPELINECVKHHVHQVTLVPDAPDQITSDHGWVVSEHQTQLSDILETLRHAGIRASLFMDCEPAEIRLAQAVGANRVELHTESYARSFENHTHETHITQFTKAYQTAIDCGLGVNAGHDLDLHNLKFFLKNVPVAEVSIGHSLTIEALLNGWEKTILDYQHICKHNGASL